MPSALKSAPTPVYRHFATLVEAARLVELEGDDSSFQRGRMRVPALK